MLNTVYQLKRPRQFEVVFKKVELDEKHLLIRPTHLSICNADQRYYQGTRPEEILRIKLPMALIHEGIGRVVYDPTGSFKAGDLVVMIPNIPADSEQDKGRAGNQNKNEGANKETAKDKAGNQNEDKNAEKDRTGNQAENADEDNDGIIAENYLSSSKFRASGIDGFLQEYVQTVPDRVVLLPQDINPSVAAFTELASVSYHALQRFFAAAHPRMREAAVWGDGNLGYITALLLHYLRPDVRLYVVGAHEEKLSYFTFADETVLTTQLDKYKDFTFDHAVECVGGSAAPAAVNQMIERIRPEGTIALLGVTEELAPINTRMILEKGLRIVGSSRSGREDFTGLIDLYRRHPDLTAYLENIVGEEFRVRDIKDIRNAFEADIHKLMGKTVMIWDE